MAKALKKSGVMNSHLYNENLKIRSGQKIPISRPQTVQQSYDPGLYIKRDLKWSVICAAVVVILLVISYLLFR